MFSVRSWPRLLALVALCACAPAAQLPGPRHEPIEARVLARGVSFQLRAEAASDEPELGRIGSGLLAAEARAARWGSFRSDVLVRVLPDHAALGLAVDASRPSSAASVRGFEWLRAWAYGDRVFLQSPRTWFLRGLANQGDLDELLTHELTHALMYQLIEPEGVLHFGSTEEPPLWFREGMASVTARQGDKRLLPSELRRWVAEHPDKDVLNPDAEMLRTEKEAVYGAAHRTFELLLALGGDQAVRDILRGVRSGARFEDAFATTLGQPLARFEAESMRAGFDPQKAQTRGAGGP